MMMTDDILSQFESIRLEQMDAVKLMDRSETKFLLSANLLAKILQESKEHYYCQENISKRVAKYETLYYDTPDFALYMKHHNGELNRYKVRHRTYMDSNLGFLEIKYRHNKGRGFKHRMEEKNASGKFDGQAYSFLSSWLPLDPSLLQPAVTISYSRITLVSKRLDERVTLDTNIEFRRNDERVNFGSLAIAEIKRGNKAQSSFADSMKKMRVRESSFSKYCTAVAEMCDGVKKNNFKENLLTIKYLSHDIATGNN
jgi:hypothetical protein